MARNRESCTLKACCGALGHGARQMAWRQCGERCTSGEYRRIIRHHCRRRCGVFHHQPYFCPGRKAVQFCSPTVQPRTCPVAMLPDIHLIHRHQRATPALIARRESLSGRHYGADPCFELQRPDRCSQEEPLPCRYARPSGVRHPPRRRQILPGRQNRRADCNRQLAGLCFQLQQPLLPLHAPAIASEPSLRPNHSVAGNHHRQRIRSAGSAHRADGPRRPNRRGNLNVGPGLSPWNPHQRLPDTLLKRRSSNMEGKRTGGGMFAQM